MPSPIQVTLYPNITIQIKLLPNSAFKVRLKEYPTTIINPPPPGVISVGTLYASNSVIVGNSTVNVSINSTAFSGTANNSIHFDGVTLSTIQNQITGNASAAYSNAVANAAALYQTTAGLAANVATLTSNDASYFGGQLPSYYTNATNITTGVLAWAQAPANTVNTTGDFTIFGNQTFEADLTIASPYKIIIGDAINSVVADPLTIVIGNNTVNTLINSTAFSGTANNSIYLNGQPASYYKEAAGSNTEIQFNDSGVFGSSNTLVFDKNQVKLTIGNSSVNTVVNSTALVLKSLIANGSVGSAGDVLSSNGTGLYWAVPSGGGKLSGNGLTSNTTHIEVLANTGIVANSTGTFVNSAYIATIDANNSSYLGGIPAANYALLSATTSTFTGNVVANNANTINDLNVGGDLSVTGNLLITGSVVSLQGNTITFTDNMLYLNQGILATITNISGNGTVVIFTANNNFQIGWDVFVSGVNPSSYNGTYLNITAANATHFEVSNTNTASYISGGTARGKSDSNPDLGFAGGYNDGTYHHAGFFRDATDGYWKVFDGYLPEPDSNVNIDTSNNSFNIANFWSGTIRLGNTTVYSTVNTTIYTGTANNSNNLNGQPDTYYTNATNIITGTLDYARLPANVVIWSNTNTFTAVQTFNQNVFANSAVLSVGNTTSNVTTNTTHIVVGNSSVNVSINSTAFSGTSNNSTNLGGVAAANYVNTSGAYTITGVHIHNANVFVNTAVLSVGNTTANVTTNTTHIVVGNSTVNVSINSTAFSGTANNITGTLNYSSLPANVVIWSNTNTFTAVQTLNANLFVNTANHLLIGNATVNTSANQTTVIISNASDYLGANASTINFNGSGTVNATIYTGTANNSNNLNGQPASYYTNATNLATGIVPTARLATTGTPSSTTFLRGDQVWATPPGGGSGSPGGSTSDIQFNDLGSFAGNSNFTYDQTAVRLTVGNTTVNTQVNSTALVVKSIIANGQIGTSGQVLSSNGTGIYWSSGGGLSDSYETVNKNLKAYDAVYAYTSGILSTITYSIPPSSTIVKTFNYTGGILTSIVLSGATPGGIDLTKTFNYSGGLLANVVYS